MVHEACEKSARSALSGEAMPLNSSFETTPPTVPDLEDGARIVTEQVESRATRESEHVTFPFRESRSSQANDSCKTSSADAGH